MGRNWGEWIKAKRLAKDLSRKQLADLIGMDEQSVGRWERGQGNPRNYAKIELEKVFGFQEGEQT